MGILYPSACLKTQALPASVPSRVPALRQPILGVTPGICLLGHPTPPRLSAWSPAPASPERALGGFPRSIDRLVRDLRLLLYAGILSDGYHAPGDNVAWILSRFGPAH